MEEKVGTKLQRIASKDVTDSIARAMEKADDMKSVIIIYELRDDYEGRATHGVIIPDDLTMAGANYLMDVGKRWIFD